MNEKTPPAETIVVVNRIVTVPDSRRAVDLFARILRAVRQQTAEERERNGGRVEDLPPAA